MIKTTFGQLKVGDEFNDYDTDKGFHLMNKIDGVSNWEWADGTDMNGYTSFRYKGHETVYIKEQEMTNEQKLQAAEDKLKAAQAEIKAVRKSMEEVTYSIGDRFYVGGNKGNKRLLIAIKDKVYSVHLTDGGLGYTVGNCKDCHRITQAELDDNLGSRYTRYWDNRKQCKC